MEPIIVNDSVIGPIRQVAGYIGYGVDGEGNVYRLLVGGKAIKASETPPLAKFPANRDSRQPYVRLGRKNTPLCQIVAQSWLPTKPFQSATIRHIDGDKWNCSAQNLVWE